MEVVAAFAGCSVNDLEAAKVFYQDTLGLSLNNDQMGLEFALPGGGKLFVYPKPDHQAAGYTFLNLVVADIDAAVDDLAAKGVTFEHYDNMPGKQDEKGIMRSPNPKYGPHIAWFKDPAGNILSVMQDAS